MSEWDEIAVAGLATVAHEEKLRAMLTTRNLDTVEAGVKASVYWQRFCELVATGEIRENWLAGDHLLGRTCLYWAGWKEVSK